MWLEFLLTIASFSFALSTLFLYTRNKELRARLNDALLNAQSTPIKELAAEFRNFVQGIDGHVSPEIEAAIKKLEEEQKPKALPPPKPVKPTTKARQTMDVKTWNIFVKDFKAATFADEKISVVKRWGKKYIFDIEDQVNLIKAFHFDDDREDLRDYFDKHH